ncbi:MAG: HAD-IIB family hydrolase [Erysipelotrichaceae bacterium]|nr:HAD-IIB family hydrolase [Erysipelotrichaceae bacterium]MDY5251500.1 HAD-IIB family hydrolase [Erysipelotrichaceae bacterium]
MIIAFDLDGSLLNSKKAISPLTLKVLSLLKNQGHILIPCTGRSLQGLPAELLTPGFCDYAILSNGAIIYDMQKQATLFTSCFTSEEFAKIIDLLTPYKVDIDYNADGQVFSDRYSIEHLDRYHIQPELLPMIKRSRTIVEDIKEDVVDNKRQVNRANIFFEDLALRSQLFAQKETLPFDLTTSVPHNGEITKKGINKGFGIKYMCQHLQLPLDQVMFFGDADNDKEALALDINSVLMCNGNDELKQVAKQITAWDNDHDGLAKYLINYFKLSI